MPSGMVGVHLASRTADEVPAAVPHPADSAAPETAIEVFSDTAREADSTESGTESAARTNPHLWRSPRISKPPWPGTSPGYF